MVIRNRNTSTQLNRLHLLQINLNKLEKAHLELINGTLGRDWDIILLQEPYLTQLGHIRTPNGFTCISPHDRLLNQEALIRSAIWVNGSLSSNSWKAINIPGNNDLTALQLNLGYNGKLMIFNIYNDCKHSINLNHLQSFINAE